jgi:hypothetical protein
MRRGEKEEMGWIYRRGRESGKGLEGGKYLIEMVKGKGG